MSKRKSPKREPTLFDLPLHANREGVANDPGQGPVELDDAGDLPIEPALPEATPTTLFPEPAETNEAATPDEAHAEIVMEDGASDGPTAPEPPAPLKDRLLAGLLDLGIQLLVVGAAFAAVQAMGIPTGLANWTPFAILALIFSFLYWFIPLAFWGQTPGMAWVGNSALGLTDEPLTFTQTVLRWIGAILTLAFAGLPLLLALGGRSFTDRLSDSKTVVI